MCVCVGVQKKKNIRGIIVKYVMRVNNTKSVVTTLLFCYSK